MATPTLEGHSKPPLPTRIRASLSTAGRRVAAITPSRWLVISVLALDSLLVLSAFLGIHYFGLDIATTISYPPVDGHCQVAIEGIGNHCFSDYSIFSKLALSANPWVNDESVFVNYLAGGLLPHWIFSGIGQLFSSARLGLILYLLAACAAIITPAIWATRNKSIEQRIVLVSLFGILSVPGLVAIDRGNTVAFAVPGLLFFIVGMARNNPAMIAIAVAAATLVKPQYALLLVAVLALRRWKTAAWSVGGIAVSNALAYALWPTSFPAAVTESLNNAITFGGTYVGAITEERAQTVSFGRAVLVVEEAINNVVGTGITTSPMISAAVAGGLLLAGALLLLLLLTGRAMPPALLASFAVAVASMALTTSYSYYAVFALPIAAVVLTDPLRLGRDRAFAGILDRLPRSTALGIAIGLIVVSLALTVTRIILPVVSSTDDTQLMTSTTVVPIIWVVTTVFAATAFALRRGRNDPEASPLAPQEDRRP